VRKNLVKHLDLVNIDNVLAYEITMYNRFIGNVKYQVPLNAIKVSQAPKKGDYFVEKHPDLSYLSMKGTGKWKISRSFFEFVLENPEELQRISDPINKI
jgi:hypothetical protein